MPAGNVYMSDTKGNKEAGLDYIEALRRSVRRDVKMGLVEIKPEDLYLGSFGIRDKDGYPIKLHWKVDGWRKKDYASTCKDFGNNIGPYSQSLLDSMFKGWK